MKIPFNKIQLPSECETEVLHTLRSGWLTNGPKTIALEEYFKNRFQRKYALATNSGTAALHLAVKSLRLASGDQVVVPSITYTATANAVLYNDLDVVFSDVCPLTHNIDPDYLEQLLESDNGKKIKAVIIVHVAGVPVDMDRILSLKSKFNFHLIEDATHCLPGKWKNRDLGTFGDISVFSFNPTKNIPGADGGLILVDSEEKYSQMKVWRINGVDKDAWKRNSELEQGWEYDVVDLGFKYNASDLSSALVLAQLPYLEKWYQRKLKIVEKYILGLSKIKEIKLPFNQYSEEMNSAWHLFIIQAENRNELYNFLMKSGIHTNVHYKPLHLHSFWKNYSGEIRLPKSESAFQSILSLPLYHSLTDEEVGYIIEKISEFYQGRK